MGVKYCIILHNISVSTNTKSKMGSSNRMSDHIWLTPEQMGCKHVCPYSFLTCIVILTVLKMSRVTRAIQKAECLLKWVICRKKWCSNNYQSENSSLNEQQRNGNYILRAEWKNILNLLQRAYSTCPGCAVWRGSALTFFRQQIWALSSCLLAARWCQSCA